MPLWRSAEDALALPLASVHPFGRHSGPARADGHRVLADDAALFYDGAGSPKDTITDAQAVAMTSRWLQLDWVRVAGTAAAFVAALTALTLPWPGEVTTKDAPIVRALLVLALSGVAALVVWFVANI